MCKQLERYAELKNLEKNTESEIKFLKPKVMEIIAKKAEDGKTLENAYGVFTLGERPSYKYSEELTDKISDLKERQKAEKDDLQIEMDKEIKMKVAKKTTKNYPIFNPAK